ncbi:MAG TPA: DUF6364 family protein [Kiritimatiellia bacterium]|nr:DUF6364 family protein [Kiritimatiellia bacterium]HMO97732.1 DUF6364 family protein [Kiritimatiellia bacterium]HMP95371.1 DUF6364 family protein [Kiritimatiellia bacterium]
MKNVTITLPDEIARRAKVFAAERNTSVSRFVGELLAERLETELGYRKSMNQWLARKPTVINESKSTYPRRDELYE